MSKQPLSRTKRRPGRPPTYVFNKPDTELSENERRLKGSVIKRRLRQNRSYHKKKGLRKIASQQKLAVPLLPHHLPITAASIPHSHLALSFQPPTANLPPPNPTALSTTSLDVSFPSNISLQSNVSLQSNISLPHISLPSAHLLPVPSPPTQTTDLSGTSSNEERDEERLLEEIFDVSAAQSLPQSDTMLRNPACGPFLGSDILARLSTLPFTTNAALKSLLIFPASFSLQAAINVVGTRDTSPLTFPAEVLQPLLNVNLIRPLPSGRYELNEITKSVVSPDSFSAAHAARQRFVDYFSTTLSSLDPQSLSRDGKERLKAMQLYDAERINMRAALQMCRDVGGKKLVMGFLTNGATVMRYSTSAHERAQIFETVLQEAEASSPPDASPSSIAEEARITLALGEAYLDLLSFENAKNYLQRAIGMMAGSTECTPLSISTSVLALLLFAELRISEREYEEAKKLLIQALRTLRDAGMQKSTFSVCCLLSLASVYSSLDQADTALATINTSLEVLVDLGFSNMPIFADTLRTLGGVHLIRGNAGEAQDTFFSALTIIQKWISRSGWEKAPFQHCTHLDIFLVEAIAKTYTFQQRHEEAARLLDRARQTRMERQLDSRSAEISNAGGFPCSPKSRMYTRHLY